MARCAQHGPSAPAPHGGCPSAARTERNSTAWRVPCSSTDGTQQHRTAGTLQQHGRSATAPHGGYPAAARTERNSTARR
eukprot:5589488-Prymnesium_polylepis.1